MAKSDSEGTTKRRAVEYKQRCDEVLLYRGNSYQTGSKVTCLEDLYELLNKPVDEVEDCPDTEDCPWDRELDQESLCNNPEFQICKK